MAKTKKPTDNSGLITLTARKTNGVQNDPRLHPTKTTEFPVSSAFTGKRDDNLLKIKDVQLVTAKPQIDVPTATTIKLSAKAIVANPMAPVKRENGSIYCFNTFIKFPKTRPPRKPANVAMLRMVAPFTSVPNPFPVT